jgi:hypothetical protein
VKAGRRGVDGLPKDMSSFVRFSGSRNLGDGDRMGSLPSDSDLPFDGDLDADFESFPPSPSLSSATADSDISLKCAPSIFRTNFVYLSLSLVGGVGVTEPSAFMKSCLFRGWEVSGDAS